VRGGGRRTERGALDQATPSSWKKGTLADLAARASDHPAHFCCSTRVVDTASRSWLPPEQVVRRPAAAIEQPHCSCRPRHRYWALGGLVHGLERHGGVRPRSMTSRGSVGIAPNARRGENIASSKVTIRRPRRALFGEVVLDNPTSVRDRWRCSQGAGSDRSVSAAGDQAPICTVRPHPSISPKAHGGTAFPTLRRRGPNGSAARTRVSCHVSHRALRAGLRWPTRALHRLAATPPPPQPRRFLIRHAKPTDPVNPVEPRHG
jgi:hypothetical protein